MGGQTHIINRFPQCQFSFFQHITASRPALRPTQPPTQLVPGVERPGHGADHSTPSSAEVKIAWSYASTPLICLNGVMRN
jgi:hypothetical protein